MMRTALVTGASRGVGRGVAIGLAEAGFRVFGTGRSIDDADLPDTVVRIRCDHLRDDAHRWAGMMDAGVRAAFMAAAGAARIMLPRRSGLIVNISSWAAQKHLGNTIYGIAKAATDKMTADMALELRPHGVAAVSLYQFIGRVIAALSGDPRLMERSGTVVVAAEAAAELGITDIDGRQPRPLTLETV